jgi:hypothetical protein
VCSLTHQNVFCGTNADRSLVHNLTVTVAGQVSNRRVYSYTEIMKNPVFTSISPRSGPTRVCIHRPFSFSVIVVGLLLSGWSLGFFLCKLFSLPLFL